LLAALQPHAFQSCFENWIAAIKSEVVETTPDEPVEREIIAVDGKTLRRSHDHQNNLGPLHLVSAWSVQFGISLGQLATDAKSNEIRAIPVLIDQISVKKAIVTIDAVGCQKEIARKIIDSRGHYVLALKGNQEKLHSAVESYIVQHMENDFAEVEVERHVEEEKGHGRRDTLSHYQLEAPKDLPGYEHWEKLRTIGIAIRNSETKTKSTNEVRYYISSLDMDGRQFARAVRGHWRIENSLHWSLDVRFPEDENRTRNRHAADNLAWLKRFAISLLKQQKDKESVAMRRRMAGWNVDYLAKVLGIIE
jgi:predicted transposase YbfD/YdcC